MNTARTIAKNSVVLLISQIIIFAFSFIITIFTARYLGTGGYGILSLATALTGIVGIIADAGLGTLIIRDISRDKSMTNKYISNSILMKILLSLLAFVAIILITNGVGYSPVVKNVIYIMMLSVVVGAISTIFISIIQANQKMEYISLSTVLNSAVLLVGTLIGVHYHMDLLFFAAIYLIANIINFIYIVIIYFWKFSIPKIEIDLSFWSPTLKQALPFGLTGTFATIYVWADTFLLSVMQDNEAVGIYNAAYKLITVLLFIPNVFNASLFPVFSKFFVSSENSLQMAFEKYFKFMLLISFPLGIGTTLLSNKIILLIFDSQFAASIVVLQVLIWSTIFIFLNSPFTQLLQSTNKQMILTKITSICMVINIALNLILIPKYSYLASSVITVITEFLVFTLVLFTIRKSGYGFSKLNLEVTIKVFIASIIMGVAILLLYNLWLPLIVLLAIAIYIAVIYLIGGIDSDDISLIKEIIGRG
ncbi:flippase [Methanobacterium subterraneum]|uniref:Flippase n=1 Tax=Methanobacterium subterraneum TaxID=59277 RepID=A0A7K4DM74_9EURY|nr:flippase [Methanobacterium subterraneum]NMO09573.1 flippase [Methanobacterium subterraneum]